MHALGGTEGMEEVVRRRRGRPRKTVPAPPAEETNAVLSEDKHQMVADCVDGLVTNAYSGEALCLPGLM